MRSAAVLFLQGGARLQFAMIPMNLYVKGKPVDLIHTGAWTKQAKAELEKVAEHRVAADMEKENFMRILSMYELDLHRDASYAYLCANNTIFGTQWKSFPDTGDVPLVADMTSEIFSRPIDISPARLFATEISSGMYFSPSR